MGNRYDDKNKIIIEKEYLKKSFLDSESSINDPVLEEISDIKFIRIKGISNFWIQKQVNNFNLLMTDVINGIFEYGKIFSYVLIGNKEGIEVYFGTDSDTIDSLITSLTATYEHIDIEKVHGVIEKLGRLSNNVGVLTGIPTLKNENNFETNGVERICKGMLGNEWAYVVLSKGMSSIQAKLAHKRIMDLLGELNKSIKVNISGSGNFGNKAIESVDYNGKNYFEILECYESLLKEGSAQGLWRSCTYFLSKDSGNYLRLKNILKGIYSGGFSIIEPIRTIDIGRSDVISDGIKLLSNPIPNLERHPLGTWTESNGFCCDCYKYKYQTVLSSSLLAILTQMPREEMPKYYVNDFVSFDVDNRNRNGDFKIGNIISGNSILDNKYLFNTKDFSRHGLIVGITGGGKTNTSKSLLSTLWNEKKIPFLSIESAKREYWEFANIEGFEKLQVFTLGSEGENSVPYRLNPFEVVGGCNIQTHIDYLLATFNASFDLSPPMPFVLEECVFKVYSDFGWDVLTGKNILGRDDYPTLDDLYYKIDTVCSNLGYGKEVESNVRAAIQARVNSLRIGGKGAMLNCKRSIDIEDILQSPTILELEDVGDDDSKAFIIGMVMIQLYEYRKGIVEGKRDFEHLLIIEEAHRLLKNVSEAQPGRAKSVEFFCNLLAEIRSYGQGILVADQSPTKLASDILKNTNLKIVHRIVMEEDRQAVGKSMNMDESQIQYLSALQRGVAAIYSEGDIRPKLVKLPLVIEEGNKSRREVLQLIKEGIQKDSSIFDIKKNKHMGCLHCRSYCSAKGLIEHIESNGRSVKYEDHLKFLNGNYSYVRLNKVVNDLQSIYKYDANLDEIICYLGFLLKKAKKKIGDNLIALKESEQKELIINFIKKASN